MFGGSLACTLGRYARALTVLALALACSPAKASEAPLCDWLSAIGDSAQALAEGRPGDAEVAARRASEARPHGAAGARAAAALGVALHASGAYGPAAEALEVALATPTVPARPHLTFLRGEALLHDGDAPAAARLLGEAARSEKLALGRRAGFLEGRALIAAGLPADAAASLGRLLQRYPDDPRAAAARLDLAAARRASGDETGAVAVLRDLWLSARPPESEQAGAQLEEWRRAGLPAPEPSAEDRLLRADRLLADARPEDALREVELAHAEAQPLLDRAQLLRAAALAGMGKLPEAAAVAEPLAAAPEPEVHRGAALVLARAAARAGSLEEAIEWYRKVSLETAPIPGLPAWRQRDIGDEAAYLTAWLPYDAGDYARAAKALAAFGQKNPRSRRAEDALWFAAWSEVRLGRHAEATRAMARLASGPLGDAATYWQGRLLGGARQRSFYERASALGGDGWYGVLARARLIALGFPASRPARPSSKPLPELLDPGAATSFAVAVELLGFGLEDVGLDELRELAGSARARAAAPHLAQLAAFAGDAELPFRMARDHLGPSRRTLRWAYPAPHRQIVEPAATAAGIEATLALAVMRRESSFRRVIRSNAGAEGLLQLRPATAERVAALLGMPPGASARLGEPTVNLPIGIHYLGLLLARFQAPASAVAGYNAGPGPTADWVRARADLPLDEWVECIPFRETRSYVKVVIADWDVYRELAGLPPAPIDPARPLPPALPGVAF
jgi:soluble lytic murein transglycosylase